jgi:HK97 family phage prohead protease
MTTRRRAVPFQIKVAEESGTFSGYGSVFGTVDSYNEVVVPGAFAKSLEKHKAEGTMPAMLWQHRAAEPIGSYTLMREDDRGLYVEGALAKGVRQADEAHILMRMVPPAIRGLSIGYIPEEDSFDHESRVTTLTQIDLWEVSPVTFAANADAKVESVRAALLGQDMPSQREVEILLRDAGFSRRQAKGLLTHGYRGLARRDVGAADSQCDAEEDLDAILYSLMKERGLLQ